MKREATRHGKVVWYLRRVGQPKIRLPGYPGSRARTKPPIMRRWKTSPSSRLQAKAALRPARSAICVRAISARTSFCCARRATQATYRNQIDPLRIEFGHIPLKQFERRHIVALMDRKAGKPGAANTLLKMLKILFGDGVIAGLMDKNPAVGVKESYRPGGSETWRADHAAMFRKRWPLGSPQRTAFEIMWSTGLRIGDALRFGPQHIRDDKISMRTGKTGWLLDGLPVSVDLRRALDAAPTPHLTYLATAHGRTRSAKAAYTWFSDAAKAAGLPAGFTAHGLRKGVLTALADAGGSEKQMQAVSGITSPRVLQGYIRAPISSVSPRAR